MRGSLGSVSIEHVGWTETPEEKSKEMKKVMMLVFAAPAMADTAASTTGDAAIDNSVSTEVITVDTDVCSGFAQGQYVGGGLIIGADGSNTVVNQCSVGFPFFFGF